MLVLFVWIRSRIPRIFLYILHSLCKSFGHLIVGVAVSNTTEGMDILVAFVVFCVGSGLCDELITCPAESHRKLCVCVCVCVCARALAFVCACVFVCEREILKPQQRSSLRSSLAVRPQKINCKSSLMFYGISEPTYCKFLTNSTSMFR